MVPTFCQTKAEDSTEKCFSGSNKYFSTNEFRKSEMSEIYDGTHNEKINNKSNNKVEEMRTIYRKLLSLFLSKLNSA